MIKDVLVNLASGTARDPAADYAISIAQAFEAHIAGIAFAFEPVIPDTAMGGVASSIIDNAIAENERAAKAALSRFDSAAKKQGLSTETLCVTQILADAVDHFGRLARRFDLSVVAQADPDKAGAEDLFVQAALFGSGRPLVVVPYIQKTPLALNRIVCCWDGSRTAARAIADASPFLAKAKAVDLLIVSTEKVAVDDVAGADMAQHLARRGFKVNLQQITAQDIDVGNAILSYVADASADFLVMGGFGHSRFREFILGGATRQILSSMTLPTMVSH